MSNIKIPVVHFRDCKVPGAWSQGTTKGLQILVKEMPSAAVALNAQTVLDSCLTWGQAYATLKNVALAQDQHAWNFLPFPLMGTAMRPSGMSTLALQTKGPDGEHVPVRLLMWLEAVVCAIEASGYATLDCINLLVNGISSRLRDYEAQAHAQKTVLWNCVKDGEKGILNWRTVTHEGTVEFWPSNWQSSTPRLFQQALDLMREYPTKGEHQWL